MISWSSKRYPTLSKSSAEAEYRGVVNVVSESCWIWTLLLELHCPVLLLRWFIVTKSVPSMFLVIEFNINAPNTLKWIFTFVREKVAHG